MTCNVRSGDVVADLRHCQSRRNLLFRNVKKAFTEFDQFKSVVGVWFFGLLGSTHSMSVRDLPC